MGFVVKQNCVLNLLEVTLATRSTFSSYDLDFCLTFELDPDGVKGNRLAKYLSSLSSTDIVRNTDTPD